MTRYALCAAALVVACALAQPAPLAHVRLDDFEDVTPWLKGDPNTDMTQAETGVRPERQIVHEGRQALAFMVRVDWTSKPGEKYPKGWPMVSRTFKEPQDWSGCDQVEFWLYIQTQNPLPKDRVLGFGVFPADRSAEDWNFPQGLVANKWQHIIIPLRLDRDLTHLGSMTFYIAESWWQDKDRINFLIDDMRLARYTSPHFQTLAVSPGFGARGKSVGVRATLAGPTQNVRIKTTLTDRIGQHVTFEAPVKSKSLAFTRRVAGARGGDYHAAVELLDAAGKCLDQREQFLRLPVPGKRTYLSLISFYTPALTDITPDKLTLLNDSAYAGVAIPVFPGYDAGPVPAYESFAAPMKLVRDTLEIDPWPWVFGNRLVGRPLDAQGHTSSPKTDPEYFQAINAMALDDKTPARADFLKQFRIAVRMARAWHSPGVVVDLEAYNDYRAYSVAYVAEKRGETPPQVIRGCERIGADMARVCAEEYPRCVVWSLFSHMLNPTRLPGYDQPVYFTPSHIILGFLDYCRQHHLPTKYLCGGEDSPGYYNRNVAALQEKIAERYAKMSWLMERYPDHYAMAGTISPYHDTTLLTWWIKDAAGGNPELRTIADFAPMFRTLFEAYDTVWIYAASAARSEPYNPVNNKLYGDVMRQALDEAAR